MSKHIGLEALLNKSVCLVMFGIALYMEEYLFMMVFWLLWGIILIIEAALDAIGEKIDKIQR